MSRSPFLGVTVLPEYFQCESINGVLDNLQRIGVSAVATSPYVMELADEATGSREPPIDAGAGEVRLLDRPLWGRRDLWVRTAPSFVPDRKLYEQSVYQPPRPNALTEAQGALVGQFIEEARRRGMRVFFQVQAAIPPGYRVQFGGPRDEDMPLLPDGRKPARRVANNASLASPQVLAYQEAMIRDLCRRYPHIDGFRFDWPEYPPYLIDSIFLDFSSHAAVFARERGLDFERMRDHVGRLYQRLHGGLTNQILAGILEQDGGRFALLGGLRDLPGVADWLHLKALLSENLLQKFRQWMNDAGGRSMELSAHAFPPPWSLVSGMDFERIAAVADSINVKLYGMHWAMMFRFYGDHLLAANPGLSERLLVKTIHRLLDLSDDDGPERLEEIRYPGPDEPHLGDANAQRRKIRQAQASAGSTAVHVLAHGYGPLDDFRRRMEIARDATQHGVWVNRYGYLSDDKLEVLRQVVGSASHA